MYPKALLGLVMFSIASCQYVLVAACLDSPLSFLPRFPVPICDLQNDDTLSIYYNHASRPPGMAMEIDQEQIHRSIQ
jgi:hypothetical protein